MAERLTPLQQQELELALCKLSPEGVDLIRGHRLNYLQMREIRLGLERGMSVEQVKPIARKWIDHSEMKELLAAVEAGEDVSIPRRPRKILPLVLSVIFGIGIVGALYFYRSMPSEKLFVPLLQKEIRLSTGMTFDPKAYVKPQLLPLDVQIRYPDSFVCTVPQVRLVVYQVSRGNETVDGILRIEIVDETAPALRLKQSEVTLAKDEVFSCMAYIEEAVDEVDGDLSSSVECSDELRPQYDQEVLYSVEDRSGNIQRAYLLVFQEEYGEEAAGGDLLEESVTNASADFSSSSSPSASASSVPSVLPSYVPSSAPVVPPEEVYEETEVIVSESVEVESSDVVVSHDASF